jgi:dienelactone hydrolase
MQGTNRRAGLIAAIAAGAATLAVAPAAQGSIASVFAGDVACTVQGDGVRFCGSDAPRSTTRTFDGTPIDVNVGFPPEPAAGPDGSYPLVMLFHGYAGKKLGLSAMRRWIDRGYATFSMTDRGFHESCGTANARAADPAGCAAGYVRLMDTRYEVRDAQVLAGRLVDEGLIDPQRIGATGGSYGGGLSMALAALRDRVMLTDGTYAPWTSPNGTPMRLAAATPNIPWTDLAYSLVPNGSTLDYVADAPYRGRFGVMKRSLVNGLYLSGSLNGWYAPEGTPGADLTGWKARLDAGEPYDGDPTAQALLDEITAHHSSYYIDHSTPPAPMLISSGFTDDLFPADEAIRFYNRTRGEHTETPLALFFGNFGHPRAQNDPAHTALLRERENAWIDFYVKGSPENTTAPANMVEALPQTCPGEAASGALTATNWARIAPGEIRVRSPRPQTIAADGAVADVAKIFDPATGGGACAIAPGAPEPGVVSMRLDQAPDAGYTLVGSPTVLASFQFPGDTSQVAARLVDVAPDGTERLVARGLWRPTSGKGRQVFQLHPNAWTFAAGHAPELELLPRDSGGGSLDSYGRASNNQPDVQVSKLELRLPVRERPGAIPGLVKAPAARLVPDGYELASDVAALGDPRAKLAGKKLASRGASLRARVRCPAKFATCTKGRVTVKGGGKKLAAGKFMLAGGRTKAVELKLTRAGRRVVKRGEARRVTVSVRSAETVGAARKRARLGR